MQILRIYIRVLEQLSAHKRIAIMLVFANLCLAVAQFAEPILFGRIIDRLTTGSDNGSADWAAILPLAAAWVGFGLFTIAAGVLVALHADKLAHSQRLTVMARYFEHVLHLPISFQFNARCLEDFRRSAMVNYFVASPCRVPISIVVDHVNSKTGDRRSPRYSSTA